MPNNSRTRPSVTTQRFMTTSLPVPSFLHMENPLAALPVPERTTGLILTRAPERFQAQSVPLESTAPPAAWLRAQLKSLAAKLSARAVIVYHPELTETGWEVAQAEWIGTARETGLVRLQHHVRAYGAEGAQFGSFDPHFVCESERNAVVVASEQPTSEDGERPRLRASLDLTSCDQMRALLCDGARLLAWLGVLRESPFTNEDQATLRALIAPLQRALQMARHAAEPSTTASLVEALLDTFDYPAFVVSQHGRLEYANRGGQEWLAADAAKRVPEMRAAVQAAAGTQSLRAQPLALGGYRLLHMRESQHAHALVLRKASREWPLSQRHLEVLDKALQGLSNKEIASAVGCAEVTVERRLTSLYRLAGVQSRAQLIARLHALR